MDKNVQKKCGLGHTFFMYSVILGGWSHIYIMLMSDRWKYFTNCYYFLILRKSMFLAEEGCPGNNNDIRSFIYIFRKECVQWKSSTSFGT